MSARNMMLGYSMVTFGTNDLLTRKQMAVVLSKAFNITPVTVATGIFSDVPMNDSQIKTIEGLYVAGFTGGCATNPLRYCPDSPVTNAEMAVFALKGWNKISPPKIPLTTTTTQHYLDVPSNTWYYKHVEALAQEGLYWYCSTGNFCPNTYIKRNETAFVINQILNTVP